MVQHDMDVLRKKWYEYGLAGTAITGDDAILFSSLDSWQKQELRNEYWKGIAEVITS